MSVRWDDGEVRPVWPPMFGRVVLILVEAMVVVTFLLAIAIADAAGVIR